MLILVFLFDDGSFVNLMAMVSQFGFLSGL